MPVQSKKLTCNQGFSEEQSPVYMLNSKYNKNYGYRNYN